MYAPLLQREDIETSSPDNRIPVVRLVLLLLSFVTETSCTETPFLEFNGTLRVQQLVNWHRARIA